MWKNLLVFFAFFISGAAFSQDYSNKGKDFWICYPDHIDGTNSAMGIYITSDVNATGQINVAGTIVPFTVTANTVTYKFIGPGASGSASNIPPYLSQQDGVKVGAGIHLTADKDVAVYVHIIKTSRSGATLVLPTKVWGKEYLVPSYRNTGGSTGYGELAIMASIPNTIVEITPAVTTRSGRPANTPFQITLANPGDVYQLQFASALDLSGTRVRSLPSGPIGCLPIAVYSATTWTAFPCNSTGDNLLQQIFPIGSWGKQFLTSPLKKVATSSTDNNTDIIRVFVNDPLTVVTKTENGITTTLTGLILNTYYEYTTYRPTFLNADKPIQVVQYITSQSCGSPATQSDPEMIVLNAVEQTINDITVFSAHQNFVPPGQSSVSTHYLNVIMQTANTAAFKINGVAPAASFIPIPGTNYSYLKEDITTRAATIPVSHLSADSGFSAIAYGFGNVESYGYNAGTNVKDLYQQIGVHTQYGIETTPSVCTNSPFQFKVSLPYIPDSMYWDFHSAAGMLPNNTNVMVDNSGNATEDSATVVNGKTIHWYSLPTQYYFTTIGVYPITITTYVPNGDCGTTQEINFDLTVSDPPVADFAWTPGGCVAEPYQFIETTPQLPKPTYRWWWDFGDPGSGAANNSALRNPVHTFTTPGLHSIRYAAITTPGCLSDTIVHQVDVPLLPSATISGNTTVCINSSPLPDITFTGTAGTPPYTFTYNINGGTPLTVNSVASTATVQAPTNVAGTFIYTLTKVQNAGSALCTQDISGQTATVIIIPDHTITLSSAGSTTSQTVCINTPIINITYTLGGGATGATITGLPAGVTYSVTGATLTISGSPSTTVGSPFAYSITTTGNSCLTASAGGTITVSPDHTITLSSGGATTSQTVCINTPIVNITYTLGGGATGATVTGLPAGVTAGVAGNTLTISGTPSTTTGSPFSYSIATTGNNCITASANGTITVIPDHTITLSSAGSTTSQTVCINTPIINITYTLGGGATGATVTGLPAGVNASVAGNTLTISGTPSTTTGSPFNYSITTTGNNCVTASANGTITVSADHTITLSSAGSTTSQSVCMNTAIIPIVYTLGGGATGGTVTGLPPGVTASVTGALLTISGAPTTTAGSPFSYAITTTGNPCITASAGGTITVYNLPTADFSYSAPSCETRIISFTDLSTANSGILTNWAWNFGDGSPVNTSQNPTHIFAAAGMYTVTLTVTSNLGCTNALPFTRIVTIDARPQAGYIIPSVCLNDTYAQFIDTSHIAAGSIISWAWNFGDPGSGPNNTSTLQNPQHSYSAVGLYQVVLIVTSNNGCKDTIEHTLSVNGSFPVADFNIINPATLCANDSVALMNTSTVFPGNITRVEIYWDNVGAPTLFDVDNAPIPGGIYKHLYPNFQAPLTKIYTIRLQAYSGGVCLSDKLSNITVNAAPLVQFNAMPDTCLLVNPFQLTQASEIGGVPGTGTYSGPGVSPTGLFSPVLAGVGTHRIMYTFTSTAAGCIDTMSNTITVLDTAHAAFTFVSPTCEQVPASFTDVSTAPATVTLSNTIWDFGDGSPIENHAPGATFGHSFPGPGTYTVTMYTVSAYGCNSTVTSQSVTVDPNHIISLNPGSNANQTVCINTPIAPIVYTLSGGATGATVTGLPAGVTYTVVGTTVTISGSPTTTVLSPFAFTVLTTGNTCVVATATGSIAVEADHTITLSSTGSSTDQSVCVNSPIDPITYTLGGGASGVTIAGLPPGISYAVAGTVLTISGAPTSTAGGPVFAYVITTTGNSCIRATAAGSIKVNPYPVPNFTVDKPSYCIPNAIVIFNNSSSMPDASGMTYAWNFDEPLSGGANTSSGVSPTHWYSAIGPFNVHLVVTSLAVLNGGVVGCTHDTTIVLNTVHPQPKADFVFNKPSVCIGDNVVITDNTDGKDGIVNQWHWDMGDGTVRLTNPVTYTYFDTISYTITMYSINNHGCNSDTINKSFTVYPYPHVNAGPDRYVLEGGSIQLQTVTFGNDAQYAWTPELYLTDSHITDPRVVNPLTDMTYRLTVTARGGCALSDDVFVKLLRFPVIPNTFTPNNDGINDTWRIDYLNTYPNNWVQVFTRTGQLVFESRGYNKPWDGTLKGKPLPIDTYYYIIEPGNGRDPITGYVTILK